MHTWRLIVADGEDLANVRTNVGQAIGTFLDCTANLSSLLPDDLRVVAPFLKATHVRVVVAIRLREIHHLVVVHQVGNQLVNMAGFDTSTNVLAISTTASLAA
jgi:hypothetical protein